MKEKERESSEIAGGVRSLRGRNRQGHLSEDTANRHVLNTHKTHAQSTGSTRVLYAYVCAASRAVGTTPPHTHPSTALLHIHPLLLLHLVARRLPLSPAPLHRPLPLIPYPLPLLPSVPAVFVAPSAPCKRACIFFHAMPSSTSFIVYVSPTSCPWLVPIPPFVPPSLPICHHYVFRLTPHLPQN